MIEAALGLRWENLLPPYHNLLEVKPATVVHHAFTFAQVRRLVAEEGLELIRLGSILHCYWLLLRILGYLPIREPILARIIAIWEQVAVHLPLERSLGETILCLARKPTS